MELDYQKPADRRVPAEHTVYSTLLNLLAAYFVLSSLTLPFIGEWWLGSIPPFALIQVPKTEPADWLRTDAVMPAIRRLGVSRGSFSPDYTLARPYALAIVYVVPFAPAAVVWFRTRPARRFRRLILVVLVLGVVDYAMTLVFAESRSLTIY